MALLNRYNSLPASLPNKEFALVKVGTGPEWEWFVGDENNLPVPVAKPKEHQINGTRLTANITGTFNFDWNAASQFILTPTGAVTLGNTNLPVSPNTKVISGVFKASSFAVTFPASWKAKANNDPLSATLDTHFTAETISDTVVLFTLENIPA